MKREAIESEVIASMGYDPVWKLLELEFRQSGEIYHYFEVPPAEYSAFRNAVSKGTYLNTVFKSRDYRSERVE